METQRNPYNTAGWTSVEIAGKIIEKIGPILAINKIDFYDNHVVKNLISNLKSEDAALKIKGISFDSRSTKKEIYLFPLKAKNLMVMTISSKLLQKELK